MNRKYNTEEYYEGCVKLREVFDNPAITTDVIVGFPGETEEDHEELKEFVADRLNKTAKELYGIDNFTDMIGDETIAEDPETLVAFLTEKGHPALGLDPMM